jgi:hypothetical protein
MIRSEKKLKELAEILNKDNNILISDAIQLLREDQPFEGAISLLTAFYNKTGDFSIRRTIEGFMNDLKDQSAGPEVMQEIRKDWNDDTIGMLVSSCWQSGLDYSDYCIDFAKVFLRGDYPTAIECMTVIEESLQDLSMETRNEIIELINESPFSPSDEKRSLIHELISLLGK